MGAETRRAAAASRHKKSSPPILSHEFFIQNHGDIFSCVLMVFIIGLMFPVSVDFLNVLSVINFPFFSNQVRCFSSPLACPIFLYFLNTTRLFNLVLKMVCTFCLLHHYDLGPVELNVYSTGVRDLATIFFYTAAWIVGHAVIQEYVLDKLQRKVLLSVSS